MKFAKSFVVLVPLIFGGCFSNLATSVGMDVGKRAEQESMFIEGDYAHAAALADKNKENLSSMLRAGNYYLYANDYKRSIALLDESEAVIKNQHEKMAAQSAAEYMAQLMINDAAIPYSASISEAVMVNTYKAIDYMALGKFEEARVELNRAIDRQRRAKETYAELIAKQKSVIAQKRREKKIEGFDKTMNNPQIKDIVRANYSSLEQFEAYPDFINPFTTYLAGLFFLIEGDYAKSSSLLKEAYGMMPQNETIKSDFLMVERALDGVPIRERYVWVIYENGLAPIKKEYKINIPMYMASQKVLYMGIALPKMEPREQATPYLAIFSGSKEIAKTSVVGDIERVIFSEFRYSYNDILTRAVFSMLLKTYSQHEASEKNPYFGLATAAFQLLTTHA
ncbi:hypothetical protein, partial [Sulfurimonas sp.]|uniref:hypothetical protein n=1 Tax=Sulfurimonas sp. TaxID=2022749 RepID=UPI0025ED8910